MINAFEAVQFFYKIVLFIDSFLTKLTGVLAEKWKLLCKSNPHAKFHPLARTSSRQIPGQGNIYMYFGKMSRCQCLQYFDQLMAKCSALLALYEQASLQDAHKLIGRLRHHAQTLAQFYGKKIMKIHTLLVILSSNFTH